MSTWTYYAVFEPPFSSVDGPDTILRQRLGAHREDAERLIRSGDWKPLTFCSKSIWATTRKRW